MTKLQELVAILCGPGAMCRMSEAEALDVANDVIQALRKPSEAMFKAGGECEPFDTSRTTGHPWHPGQIVASTCWRSMCDAILAEADEATK